MDDRKPPISQSASCGKTDAGAALIDSVRQGSSGVQGSSVVYFCSAEEISEGFTIALRAKGFETEILLSDIVPRSDTPSKEER